MSQKILSKKQNPFLGREEILMEIEAPSTPSKQEIADNFKEGEVVVRKIFSNYGKNKFLAEVFIYESEQKKLEVESIPKKIRKKMEEERAKKEAEEKAEKTEAESESQPSEEQSEDNPYEEQNKETEE